MRPASPGVGQIGDLAQLTASASVNLSAWGLTTTVHYGVTKGSIDYGVCKQLGGPFSTQVERVQYPQNSSRDESHVSVRLGTSF